MAKGTIMFKNMANKFKVYLECKISDIKNIKELGIIEVLNRTKVIIISLISFMMIFGFILFNAINISEEEMLEDLKKSLITENSFKIAKIIRVRDEKISESEFKPLFNYYSGNEDKIKKLINELRKNGEYGNFEIKSKQGLFYKRYYIALDTVEVEFTTNTKDIKVEFEDKKFNLQDVAKFDVIPGIYNVKYTYETQFGDICNDINISILEDKKVELKIDGNYVTLYSNFDDAKVFIKASAETRLIRRLKRDHEERGRSYDSILKQYFSQVIPSYEDSIGPSSNYADMIMENNGETNKALNILLTYIKSMIN